MIKFKTMKQAIFYLVGWYYQIDLGEIDETGKFLINGYDQCDENYLKLAMDEYKKQGYKIIIKEK